jgi:hypothetical protein
MGLDVETFNLILNSGFEELWLHQQILHYDTESLGDSHPSRRSLDAIGALGLASHYLNSMMMESSLQQIFSLTPSTAYQYTTFGLAILHKMLCNMHDKLMTHAFTTPLALAIGLQLIWGCVPKPLLVYFTQCLIL